MDIEHNNIDKKEIKTNYTFVQVISKCSASVALLNRKATSRPKINFSFFFLADILGVVINIDEVSQITTRATNRQVCGFSSFSLMRFLFAFIALYLIILLLFNIRYLRGILHCWTDQRKVCEQLSGVIM